MNREEIQSYRVRLDLLAKTLKTQSEGGNTFHYCTPELWRIYDGTNPSGGAIYRSYTNAELRGLLIDAAAALGRAPRQHEIYCVYRQYIRLRFGNWPRALEAAGLRTPKKLRNTHNE